MTASEGGEGLAIATLIAAGRLDHTVIAHVRALLSAAGVRPGEVAWIDHGDAADLVFTGAAKAARGALARVDGIDFAVRDGERRPARLFVADMDSTMIGQECIDELADYAGFKDQVAQITDRVYNDKVKR